jgi:general stress protein 26
MGLDDTRIQRFLATREVAVLATVQADGAPLAMPMWFLHAPDTLTMISVADTQKVRNLKRDSRT